MTDAAHENSIRLDELVDDLRRLVERILDHRERQGAPLPFEKAETELQGNLHLHILDYISFLEAQDNIEYDRDRDVLLAAEAVDEVVDATDPWMDEVRFEFSKEIVDSPLDNSSPEDEDLEMIDDALDDEDEFGFDDVFQGGGDESLEMDVSRDSSQVDVDPIEEDSDVASADESGAAGLGEGDEASDPASTAASSPSDVLDDDSNSSLRDDSSGRASGRNRRATGEDSPETDNDDSSTSTDSKSMNDENRRRRDSSRRRSSSTSRPERYERIEEIGSGGVGTVYKGRHVALDREVAIKEISNVFDVFADLQREDIVKRFTDITQTQAAISHPAVLQIYDLEAETEYPFVVSEFAPRGSLRRLIENDDDRSLSVALKYFIQILHGLNAAHQADVVHGSLKPENVVLDASGNAKLSDFGLTTLVDLSGASNQVYVGVGTVSYMAPEQFEDPNAATVETDIYSLGIMFYEMLTGKVPGRRSPMPSSFYPEIPRKLDDIFDRMSMDAPEDRYQSVEAILTDFYGESEIIELLDRQSGVVFLRDPIEYGDTPLVDEEGEPRDEPLGPADAGGGVAEPVDEVADGGAPDDDAAAADAEDGDDEASEQDEDGGDAEADDPEDFDPEEVDPEDIDPDEVDDEVLEKLDEYSEMFDEDEEDDEE